MIWLYSQYQYSNNKIIRVFIQILVLKSVKTTGTTVQLLSSDMEGQRPEDTERQDTPFSGQTSRAAPAVSLITHSLQ